MKQKKKEDKAVPVAISLPPQELAKLKAHAKKEGRSLSSLIRWMLGRSRQ